MLIDCFLANFASDPSGKAVAKFGVLRSPTEFVDAARALDHPAAGLATDDVILLNLLQLQYAECIFSGPAAAVHCSCVRQWPAENVFEIGFIS